MLTSLVLETEIKTWKKNEIFQLLLCNREQVGGAIDVSKTYECM